MNRKDRVMVKEPIRVSYLLETKVETIERAVELLLAEMTSGIQYVSTLTGVQMDLVKGNVPYVDTSVDGEVIIVEEQDDSVYYVEFVIPSSNLNVKLGGITNLWPVIAGEVFNFYFLKRATLVGFSLPLSFEQYYKGPGYGIDNIRKITNVNKGPLFGTIIKPNVGLDPKSTADIVTILAKAGFDFVKDDEICISPDLCPLKQRVTAVAEAIEDIQQLTGKKILYAANITSDFSVLGKAAEIAVESGAGCLMVDPFCTGLSSIDFLRRNFDLPIYVHRVGYGIYCYNSTYSISYDVFVSLFRLFGADFSHVGGIWGQSDKGRKETAGYVDILRGESFNEATWPVVTGISLDSMNEYYRFYGDDTMFMEHIGIYSDEASSRKKLESLKEKLNDKT